MIDQHFWKMAFWCLSFWPTMDLLYICNPGNPWTWSFLVWNHVNVLGYSTLIWVIPFSLGLNLCVCCFISFFSDSSNCSKHMLPLLDRTGEIFVHPSLYSNLWPGLDPQFCWYEFSPHCVLGLIQLSFFPLFFSNIFPTFLLVCLCVCVLQIFSKISNSLQTFPPWGGCFLFRVG